MSRMPQTRAKQHNRMPSSPIRAPRPAGRIGAVVLLCAALAGCADAFTPSFTAVDPSGADTGGLILGTTSFVPRGVTPGQPTGTVVGSRIAEMRSQLQQVQSEVVAENNALQSIRAESYAAAARYQTRLAEIRTRLQIGTTPGNPELVGRWNEAQADLDRFGNVINQLTQLSNQVATTAASASYLLATARATYGLTGAVDEDHRQLAVLEDETNQTVVLIDRLLTELTEDLGRQTAYLGRERDNLRVASVAILNGEWFGNSLATAAYNAGPMAATAPMGIAASRPLLIIRFTGQNVDYDQALYTAARDVINVRPDAAFELVAVAPAQGLPAEQALAASAARQNAESVRQRLTEFGIPPQRVALTEASSTAALTNEVHLYIR
jgi:hypothetical protein